MGQALYRKYRSKNLSEVVGQSHITTTLNNTLKSGKLSHAYLFTGPRGVGKTSIARILAHEVNGLTYDETSTHLDIIEIDAASNRRIDEIRELRDRVQSAPSSAKYKVYIIDEVHMLTREAFNALLKTLEEPPAHAIFILATTEAHKLPETIVSRTQRFTFKPIERDAVIKHLKSIAKSEHITISDEALGLIADHGDGSFRDSISLLDQASGISDTVSLDDVQTMLGIAPHEVINQLYMQLAEGNPQSLLKQLQELRQHGFHAANVAKQLGVHVRHLLLENKSAISHEQAIALLERLLAVPASADPEISLELSLLQTVLAGQTTENVSKTVSPKPTAIAAAPAIESPVIKRTAPKSAEPLKQAPQVVTPVVAPEPPIEDAIIVEEQAVIYDTLDDATWQQVLLAIKQHHNTLYSMARMAEPTIDGDAITLSFRFGLHQKQLNDARNKAVVIDIISKLLGRPISLSCVVNKSTSKSAAPIVAAATPRASVLPPELGAISNIFGSAEVLES